MREQHYILQQQLAEEKEIAETKNWKRWAQKYFERHSVEIILIIVFTCTAINYLLGTYSNEKLAKKWLETVKPLLK